MIRKVLLCAAAASLATAVACSKSSPTPVSPSAAVPEETAAAADGSTLKATTPSLVSPSGGTQTTDPIILTASKSAGKFKDLTPSYHFQVRSGSTVECPSCNSTRLEKQLSVFNAGVPTAFGAAKSVPDMSEGACGMCGDPRGPGACSFD